MDSSDTAGRKEQNGVGEERQLSPLRRYGWLWLLLGLIAGSILIMLGAGYDSYVGYPFFVLILIGILSLLPLHYSTGNPLADLPLTEIKRQTRPILIWALLYPVVLIPVAIWMKLQLLPLLPGWTSFYLLSWNYTVVGKIGLLLVPVIFFIRRYGGSAKQLGVADIANAWGWIVPLGIAALYILFYSTGVWRASMLGGDHSVPFGLVLLMWLIALFGAGFPEEYFYRVLLQTRLELLLGRWNGLALATLLFGLLHLPSRYPFEWLGKTPGGSPLFELVLAFAAILLVQTAIGFFLGFMWMRYRNAWAQVLLHTAIDALTFVYLLTGGRLGG